MEEQVVQTSKSVPPAKPMATAQPAVPGATGQPAGAQPGTQGEKKAGWAKWLLGVLVIALIGTGIWFWLVA